MCATTLRKISAFFASNHHKLLIHPKEKIIHHRKYISNALLLPTPLCQRLIAANDSENESLSKKKTRTQRKFIT